MKAINSGSAVVSPCGLYRYRLTRRWHGGPSLLFVMLNPSTADAEQDDPTTRRCIGFAKRDGFGAIEVINLFAWRATDPSRLLAAMRKGADIVGPQNDFHSAAAAEAASRIVFGWGRWRGDWMRERYLAVREILPGPTCLAVNADGSPMHPLFIRGDSLFCRWPFVGSEPFRGRLAP